MKGPYAEQKAVPAGPRSVKPVGHVPDTSGERRKAVDQNYYIRQKSEIFAAYHEDPRAIHREPEPEQTKFSMPTQASRVSGGMGPKLRTKNV